MLKKTRLAALAAFFVIAIPLAVMPQAALAQAQPPATAEPAPATQAPPVAKDAEGTRTTEIVENPYGLEAVWKGGDIVLRITLGILIIMSLGSWYVIVTK